VVQEIYATKASLTHEIQIILHENSPEIEGASGNYQTSELMCFTTQLQNTVDICLLSPVVQEIFAIKSRSSHEIQGNLRENIWMKIHQKLGELRVITKLQNQCAPPLSSVDICLLSPVVQEIFATKSSSTDEIQVNLHENIRMKIRHKFGELCVIIKLQN